MVFFFVLTRNLPFQFILSISRIKGNLNLQKKIVNLSIENLAKICKHNFWWSWECAQKISHDIDSFKTIMHSGVNFSVRFPHYIYSDWLIPLYRCVQLMSLILLVVQIKRHIKFGIWTHINCLLFMYYIIFIYSMRDRGVYDLANIIAPFRHTQWFFFSYFFLLYPT